MNDETILERKFGKENHFKVPEGYFCDFEKKLLTGIDTDVKAAKPRVVRMKPWLWIASTAAAIVCGLVFYIAKPVSGGHDTDTGVAYRNSIHDTNTDMMIDEVSDYAMLDNGDFYSYVSGE